MTPAAPERLARARGREGQDVKFATALLAMLAAPKTQTSLRALARLLLIFAAAVVLFSVGFHAIMEYEGRAYSWPTSIYWTVVTMSTLGFGDITFESDLGRIYSVVVLLAGSLIILILLPFTFIQFVYVPWRSAVQQARAPRELDPSTRDHIVLTGRDPVEEVLIHRAEASGRPYVLLVQDVDEAIALTDHGYRVMVGAVDDPATYRALRMDQAAMIVAAGNDQTNTNITFTVREVTNAPLIVVTANSVDSVDVLELAGASRVVQLGRLLGEALAARILAPTGRSNVLARFEDLLIAEAAAADSNLVGATLAELDVRDELGVSVIGLWDRGRFQLTRPDLHIEPSSVLVLAGTAEQLERYDELYHHAPTANGAEVADGRVVVIGGGRVGRAAARALREAGTEAVVVERLEERVRLHEHDLDFVLGDAADRAILEQAGIDTATAVLITTHDDDTNVYLTLYCRRLRPDVQILGRVQVDRNITSMHRAGADFVLSYASMGATAAWNELQPNSTLLLAEGLLVFRVPVPASLAGRRLGQTAIPATTGCNLIGLTREGTTTTQLATDSVLPSGGELLLIGDEDAEDRFLARYVATNDGPLRRVARRLKERVGRGQALEPSPATPPGTDPDREGITSGTRS
jgi:voltage-gated potassium channel